MPVLSLNNERERELVLCLSINCFFSLYMLDKFTELPKSFSFYLGHMAAGID